MICPVGKSGFGAGMDFARLRGRRRLATSAGLGGGGLTGAAVQPSKSNSDIALYGAACCGRKMDQGLERQHARNCPMVA
jgi:hypothetical protein